MKKLFKFLTSRSFMLILFIALQFAVGFAITWHFQQNFMLVYFFRYILSSVLAIYIVNTRSNPSYKMVWLLLLSIFPFTGSILYIFFGEHFPIRKLRKNMKENMIDFKKLFAKNENYYENIIDKDAKFQSHYLEKYGHYPAFSNSKATYLKEGLDFYNSLIEDLEKAEKFIFLEFFIIEEGYMWNNILSILERKANEGVDVRVLYDDIGCVSKLDRDYYKKLREKNLKANVYNPVKFITTPKHNNRDHRKILVIDGYIGYTGGINLADEYMNYVERFGYWKDTAVKIEGDGVWGLTVMFLSMWKYYEKHEEDYEKFKPKTNLLIENAKGYVQPFGDSPLDNESVGETAYLNIISKAKDYVYITTPYLIITNEMLTALCNAAKGGIDVRIITPHIPDKKLVHMVTRSFYEQLMESGVKIYEFTPGFIHSKSFVCDDKFAIVGSINMDFRSLYLHFESAVWLYNMDTVVEIKDDFLNTMEVSDKIKLRNVKNVPVTKKILRSIVRVFAPLM